MSDSEEITRHAIIDYREVGNEWCEVCRDNIPVYFGVERTEEEFFETGNAVPQLYIKGLHIHVQDKPVEVSFCVWVQDLNEFEFIVEYITKANVCIQNRVDRLTDGKPVTRLERLFVKHEVQI